MCQDVCPWNVRFASELREPAYAARQALVDEGTRRSALGARPKDGRTLAPELLAMSDEEFRVAFAKSPMKRAKLRGLKRNAAVVLGNVGTSEDVDVLAHALGDPEPLVREHAGWALERIRGRAR